MPGDIVEKQTSGINKRICKSPTIGKKLACLGKSSMSLVKSSLIDVQ